MSRKIVVLKEGVAVIRHESLMKTFAWAKENNICNEGWIKESLRTGKETVKGRKFKEGGYLFKYLDK